MLDSNITVLDSRLTISEKDNRCHKINKKTKVTNRYYEDPCSVVAVVSCMSKECEYTIKFSGIDSYILLRDK